MIFTIKKLENKIVFEENKKIFSYIGYAFLDKFNHTIIIVYGENKLNLIKKYLNEISYSKIS